MFFDFIQFFINGLSIGSLYALIAVGYSMVFGVLKFVNFAHGEIYMLGAYFVMALAMQGSPIWFAILGGMLATGFISVLINKYIYRAFGKDNRLGILISAVCVSMFLQNFVQIAFSPDAISFPFALPGNIILLPKNLIIRVMDLIILAIMLISSTLTWLFIQKTKIGMGIRAVASNTSAAQIIGVPIYKLGSATFFIGGLLATLGGALQGMAINQIIPLMGVGAGLKAFAAAVLGGVGSIWGAVAGAMIIGMAESILIGLGLSLWKDSLAFVILISFLLFRPQGLFGNKQIVKV